MPGRRRRAGRHGVGAWHAAAGWQVDLVDQKTTLGGTYADVSRLQAFPAFGRLISWYETELARRGVQIQLGSRADWSQLKKRSYEAVVVATGAEPGPSQLTGPGRARVVDARTWLHEDRPPPSSCVIFGAGRDGVVLADHLASRGTKVVLLGAESSLAPDMGRRAKVRVIPRLLSNPDVRIRLGADLGEIGVDSIHAVHGGTVSTVHVAGPVIVAGDTIAAPGLTADPVDPPPPLGVHLVGSAAGSGDSLRACFRSATTVVAYLNRCKEDE